MNMVAWPLGVARYACVAGFSLAHLVMHSEFQNKLSHL